MNPYLAKRCIVTQEDPLEFLKAHQKDYPHLVRIARRYLSALATSNASEGTLSEARDVFDYKRISLIPATVEVHIFFNRNLPLTNIQY